MKNFLKSNGAIICLVVVLFLVMGIVFILMHMFTTKDFSYQICCALIGTIITAVITVFLLQGQSSADGKKDKNIKIYENKLEVYSEYVRLRSGKRRGKSGNLCRSFRMLVPREKE